MRAGKRCCPHEELSGLIVAFLTVFPWSFKIITAILLLALDVSPYYSLQLDLEKKKMMKYEDKERMKQDRQSLST